MSNELKIGLTVILAVFVGYAGFRFMSDVPLFRQGTEIHSVFDRVDGLTTGSQVFMNGVRIGSVKNIGLTSGHRVRVVMTIEGDVRIPADSRARLTSTGILEGKAIIIDRGSSADWLSSGDELDGVFVDSIMETLGGIGQDLGEDFSASFNELNQLLGHMNETLDDNNRQAISQAIGNLELTTATITQILTSRQRELEEAIVSANRMMSQLDTMATDNRPRVDSLLTNLEASAADFRKVSEELDVTVDQLNQILLKINNGEGTIGKMVNDPSFYNNADSLSIELRNLIRGINENPGRYLRHMNLIDIF